MPWTYILRCADGSLYTGWTTDLPRRLAAHNRGKGSRYVRSRLPAVLFYCEAHESRQAAMRREWEIKQMSHQEKLALGERRNSEAEAKGEKQK